MLLNTACGDERQDPSHSSGSALCCRPGPGPAAPRFLELPGAAKIPTVIPFLHAFGGVSFSCLPPKALMNMMTMVLITTVATIYLLSTYCIPSTVLKAPVAQFNYGPFNALDTLEGSRVGCGGKGKEI